jgi:hypothetical protein
LSWGESRAEPLLPGSSLGLLLPPGVGSPKESGDELQPPGDADVEVVFALKINELIFRALSLSSSRSWWERRDDGGEPTGWLATSSGCVTDSPLPLAGSAAISQHSLAGARADSLLQFVGDVLDLLLLFIVDLTGSVPVLLLADNEIGSLLVLVGGFRLLFAGVATAALSPCFAVSEASIAYNR